MLFKLRFVQDRLIKDTSSDDQHNRNVKIHSEQTKMERETACVSLLVRFGFVF